MNLYLSVLYRSYIRFIKSICHSDLFFFKKFGTKHHFNGFFFFKNFFLMLKLSQPVVFFLNFFIAFLLLNMRPYLILIFYLV